MKDRASRGISRTAVAGFALLGLLAGAPAGPEDARAAVRLSGMRLADHMRATGPSVGPTLRRRPLTMLDGSKLSIASTTGQVVVINFWATWCRSCVHELRTLERLDAEIAPRGGRVIAVSIDQNRRNLERFVKAARLELPVAHDGPDGLARELDLRQVPLTLVLDRSGAVAWCSSRTDEAGLAETRATTLRLLDRPAAPPAIAGEGQGGTR